MVPLALTVLAAAALMLVVVQLLLLTTGQIRSFAAAESVRRTERQLFNEKLQLLRVQHQKAAENVLPWNGSRKFQVLRKVFECADACSFYLKPHDNKPLPAFRPGQYLTFQLNIPGRQKHLIRCYSLSDRPRSDFYRVTIKRVPCPKDKPEIPPGIGSGFFHENVKEGDILDVRAPSGGFFLDLSRPGPVVLIAGGVGITPVLSMLNEIIESGSRRETWFFYGLRNRQEHMFKEHLEKIAAQHDNVHLHVCYSQPAAKDTQGKDYQHANRVSVQLLKELLPSNNYDFYICGPGPMMEAMVQGLSEWGVPESAIHFEAFGPASVKKTSKAPAAATEAQSAGIEVRFEKSNKTVPWSNPCDSVLDVALAAEVPIEFGCRAGDCGTCQVAIKSGSVRYLKSTGHKPEAGTCLTCCCVPEGQLVLDA